MVTSKLGYYCSGCLPYVKNAARVMPSVNPLSFFFTQQPTTRDWAYSDNCGYAVQPTKLQPLASNLCDCMIGTENMSYGIVLQYNTLVCVMHVISV